jgi:hypothetical protein
VPEPSAESQSSGSGAATSATPHDSANEPVTPTPDPVPTTKPHRATVTYDAGLLSIQADDSSLNAILRQIASLTGMEITGGMVDERVFGNYGPSKPSVILATLLDGTGSDMVLRQGTHAEVTELVLIPRDGGTVPPGPNSPIWGRDGSQSDGK